MKLPPHVLWENIKETVFLGELKDQNGELLEESYQHSNILLEKHFKSIDFTDLNSIYHIVSLLNGFYSTRMGAERCFYTAKLIHQNQEIIHTKLEKGDIDLIDWFMDLCGEEKSNLKIKPYSFFTKFCALYTYYNKQECKYPIYDSLVIKVLKNEFEGELLDPSTVLSEFKNSNQAQSLLRGNKIAMSRIKNAENYKNFYIILSYLKEQYEVDFRTLDIFLWRCGKSF